MPADSLNYLLKLAENHYAISDRVHIFSRQFLGKPYLSGAQGEGLGKLPDQAPLYRFDCFDCVTYVNNVLALAYARTAEKFLQTLLRINYYDAKPVFENRFHFMSCDWNLQNQENGFVKNITNTIQDETGSVIAVTATTEINKPNWYEYQNMPVPSNAKVVKSTISYVPLKLLFDEQGKPDFYLFSQLPSLGIIEIVRPNWNLVEKIGTHLHVSHLGFLIRENNQFKFRHASSEAKKLVEVDLIAYLKKYLQSDTIKGICIFSLTEV